MPPIFGKCQPLSSKPHPHHDAAITMLTCKLQSVNGDCITNYFTSSFLFPWGSVETSGANLCSLDLDFIILQDEAPLTLNGGAADQVRVGEVQSRLETEV